MGELSDREWGREQGRLVFFFVLKRKEDTISKPDTDRHTHFTSTKYSQDKRTSGRGNGGVKGINVIGKVDGS